MGFGEKLKQFVTGKTAEERKAETSRMMDIRKKVFEEQLKEREAQAIRYAKEKEKAIYEKKIKQLRQPSGGFFKTYAPEYKTYGSPFGQPRFQKKVIKIIKKGKGKKARRKVFIEPQRRTDILGNMGGIKNGKYDVLGI